MTSFFHESVSYRRDPHTPQAGSFRPASHSLGFTTLKWNILSRRNTMAFRAAAFIQLRLEPRRVFPALKSLFDCTGVGGTPLSTL